MRSLLKYWLPLILWLTMISLFSTDGFSAVRTSRYLFPLFQWVFPNASPDFLEALHFLFRKLGHWTEYFVLAILVYRALRRDQRPLWQWRWAAWTLSVVFLYALADELHQAFVPSRGANLKDSFLDFLGGSCALALLYLRYRAQTRALLLPVQVLEGGSPQNKNLPR